MVNALCYRWISHKVQVEEGPFMDRRFSTRLGAKADKIWRAIYAHPFLDELQAGTLPLDRFVYFMTQDYRYLLDFAQVLSLGAAKSPDMDTLEIFNRHSLMAIQVERTFHASFGRKLGLSRAKLDRTPKGPVTEAYTQHLQAVGRGGNLAEIVAAILPCYWIYGEVGKRLYKRRPRAPKIYRDWIELYASKEYWGPVREQIRLMDRLGAKAHAENRAVLEHNFLVSSRYEFLFWEQAYRLEDWPV